MVMQAATRARTRAEWARNKINPQAIRCLEIDRDISQVSKDLNDLEKGVMATALMGGIQAKCEISKYNQDYDKRCDHCLEADSTVDHIKWFCKAFEPTRKEIDAELASVPIELLPMSIRSGIAPAMKTNGESTFWGRTLPSSTDQKIKRLLGVDMELHTPGENADETFKREQAKEIIKDPEYMELNARQVLLKCKQAHGSGVNLGFPTKDQINEAMQGYKDDVMITVFGDGSLTNPTKWWAAIGGFGVWLPEWNLPGQSNPARMEAAYHGPGLGQTSTPTRQELAAWLRTLAIPIRSHYATDSASMLCKANRLIEAAAKHEQSGIDENTKRFKNPFRKAWGLQTDGDLWEQAWQAVLKRGSSNQRLRKVKGHATEEDVEKGVATREDKVGNDNSDTLADKGAQEVQGAGLVKLAGWIASRHDRYAKFIRRVQKLIVGVLMVEKEERAKKKGVAAATIGYDPEKWLKSNATIRTEDAQDTTYVKLKMPPAIRGHHRFSDCQGLYQSIHDFIHQREWAHAHPVTPHSGTTWLELFVLFDTGGYRTINAQHIPNPDALERARERRKIRGSNGPKASRAKRRGTGSNDDIDDIQNHAAVAKPTLDQEIKMFKAIVRHITKHDLDDQQRKWFQMETRQNLRRLGSLGITGNQPAIAALCKFEPHEKLKIAEAILQQKVGANAKSAKLYLEHAEREKRRGEEQEEGTILLRYARIAAGAAVRWKRNFKAATDVREQGPQPHHPHDEDPRYKSRLLACTRCGHPQETAWMQLRTKQGFRAVHCRRCGKQERAARNWCQCQAIWHQCLVHRVDPKQHKSRKAAKFTPQQKAKKKEEKEKSNLLKGKPLNRKAPVINEHIHGNTTHMPQKARKELDFKRSQLGCEQRLSTRILAINERVKRKEAERKIAEGQATMPTFIIPTVDGDNEANVHTLGKQGMPHRSFDDHSATGVSSSHKDNNNGNDKSLKAECPRRKFEADIHACIQEQAELSKRRRILCKVESTSIYEFKNFEGTPQREPAEIRRCIKGNICKREADAIFNLLNAKHDGKTNKKMKQS